MRAQSVAQKVSLSNKLLKSRFHASAAPFWRRKSRTSPVQTRASNMANVNGNVDYKAWSHEDLIKRVTQLESELKEKTLSIAQPNQRASKKSKPEREFDASKYTTRLIALKIAYIGKNYNGFEHHANNTTPLPTVEEVIWKALKTSRLISPIAKEGTKPGEVNWEGCDYSKCGRTDKGVSAFGQVIGIRVRSNRPPRKRKASGVGADDINGDDQEAAGNVELGSPPLWPSRYLEKETATLSIDDEDVEDALSFDPIQDELQYATILNRLLPSDIRVLAWCPSPPIDFNARFSCRERQYRYFFTQPAFLPLPNHLETSATSKSATNLKEGWLDIAAMREAARKFLGLHDFRNFCKLDGGKQLTNFDRRIFHSDIEEVQDTTAGLSFINDQSFLPQRSAGSLDPTEAAAPFPKVYCFTLHGSAFLWHQVRHMVSVLFLVGQGLEDPSIVDELLDVEKNPCRPTYEMASDAPLVLWDCIFPQDGDPERKDAIKWLYVGDEPGAGDYKYAAGGLLEDLWQIWRERKIDEILAGSLLQVATSQGLPVKDVSNTRKKGGRSQRVFEGEDFARLQGTYVPVMKKPLMEPVEVLNERYAVRKGFESAEDMKAQGFKKVTNIGDNEYLDE